MRTGFNLRDKVRKSDATVCGGGTLNYKLYVQYLPCFMFGLLTIKKIK